MSFISLFFVLIAPLSNACLVFSGRYYPLYQRLDASLVDNGIEVCTWHSRVNQDHYFADCIPGFASYITRDMNEVAYSNHGYEHLFNPGQYPDVNGVRLLAREYGC